MTTAALREGPVAEAAPHRPSVRTWVVLGVIVLVAVWARWHRIGHDSLWFDEIYSAELSTGRGYAEQRLPREEVFTGPARLTGLEGAPGAWRIWGSINNDSQPPLYFVVLRVWRATVGDGDVMLRSLSAAMSLAALLLTFDGVRMLQGRRAALWAAAIMAVAQIQIEMAQEARSYTMLLALQMGAANAVVRLELLGGNWRRYAALGIGVLGMMLTHYFAAAGCAAIGVYALARLRGDVRRRAVVVLAAAAVAFGVLWGRQLYVQLHYLNHNASWAQSKPEEDPHPAWSTLQRFALVPARVFFDPPKNSLTAARFGLVAFLLPPLLLRRRPDLLLWWLLALALPACLLVADLTRSSVGLQVSRYLVPASAPVYALAAAAVTAPFMVGRRRIGWLIPAVLLFGSLSAVPNAYLRLRDDWRFPATFLEPGLGENGAILIANLPKPGKIDLTPSAYLCLDYYVDFTDHPAAILTEPASAAVVEKVRGFLAEGRPVWVFTGHPDLTPDRLLGAEFEGTNYQLCHPVGWVYRVVPAAGGASERNRSQVQPERP